jgi:hypothetical protein
MTHLKRLVLLAVAVAAFSISATAATAATAPGYEEFDGCPGKDVNSDVTLCATSKVVGGNLRLGNRDAPIVDPIQMSLSVAPSGEVLVGSFDGGRQPVPGGIVSLTGLDWLGNLLPANLLKAYARAELAGTPSNPIQHPVSLPIKVRLESPLLSRNCYIGSSSDPIALNLTKNTTNPPPPNQPISGTEGAFFFDPSLPDVVRSLDARLVDNAFAAPRARGCTLLGPGLGPVDHLVNRESGLPSPAGTNEAVQEVEVGFAAIEAVYPPSGAEQ